MAGFRTSARAVDMLGRQQIAGIPSAISELFKNAHDAYATVAAADFIRYMGAFVLADDGHGMSKEEFEKKWLTLGTSSKATRSAPRIPSLVPPRAILGEKGIGRLAIAAIGPQVLIVTKSIGHRRVAALIHWGVFELSHADLSELVIPVEELNEGEMPDVERMRIHILENVGALATSDDEGLYDRIEQDLARWNSGEVSKICKIAGVDLTGFDSGTTFIVTPTSPDLQADLTSTNTKEAAPLLRTLIGFANTMTPGHAVPELRTKFRDHRTIDDITDLIEEQEFFTVQEFLEADHHFEGSFDRYGQFTGTVSIFGGEPIEFPLAWAGARGFETQCGPFKLNLAYIQGRAKQSRLNANDYFLVSEKLDRYGGLYIYRDGIRVLPYGDSRFDWLDVELRRTKSASDHFFSYRRMFGAVEISRDDNSRLREKAGREGFATNEAYRQFRAILQNFLLQVAAEFFKEGGPQVDSYEEGRLANERMENARRARSKHVRERRSVYRKELDKFFEDTESQVPEARVEEILRDIRSSIEIAKLDDETSGTDRIVRAELDARTKLQELVSDLRVMRPRGVALSAELTRQSAAYEAIHSHIISSIVEPAVRAIEMEVGSAGEDISPSLHRRIRFDSAIDEAVSDSRAIVAESRKKLRKQSEIVAQNTKDLVRDSHLAIEKEVASVLQEAASTEISQMREEEFSLLRGLLTRRVQNAAAAQSSEIDEIYEQLRAIVWNLSEGTVENRASLIDQVEQLEARVEALTDRAAQDFELVQVGMAVNIVTHEFENSVKSVRDNLRRLRTWAQKNASLRPLYTDLRTSFDHLDGYLKLFTPLHRRLYREPAVIRGDEITRYLSDLFDARLSDKGITLSISDSFSNMSVRMYPSTLYPVIVNLVENSIYWLDNHEGEKLIALDTGPGMISVTDSGPGIRIGDEDHIFHQGFSRKPAGSGYGLFVAREVLRRDGADISVAAHSPDRGARFEILLPEGARE